MAGLFEADQVGQRQEIADIVSCVRADEMPFTSMVRKAPKPKKKVSDWQVEDYPNPSHAGVVDGEDVSEYEHIGRELLHGVAQKLRRPWKVSDFADETEVAGLPGGSERAHQKAAAAKVLKMMLEARSCSSEECALDNKVDAANETRGAMQWLSQDEQALYPVPAAYRPAAATQHTSTLAALTETAFENILAACFKVKRGKLNLDGFVGIDLKLLMDNWTARDSEASATNYPVRLFNQEAKSKAFVKVVDFFNFSTGQVRLHTTTYLALNENGTASDYTHKSGLFLDLSMWRLRYMRAPGMRDLPDLGGGPRGFADTIFLLECLNPLAQPLVKVSA